MTGRHAPRAHLLLFASLVIGGCGGEDTRASDVVMVEERWISEADTLWDLDTPALWTDGSRGIVLVTGKGSHDLRLFDGADGSTLGVFGAPGPELGSFDRPNAVVVVDDFALVVERDNRRIQVLSMPSGEPLGAFGGDVLEYPYGIAVSGPAEDLTLWVTDDYEGPGETVPDDLTRRLHRFEVRLTADDLPEVVHHVAFGDSTGPGRLEVVESIQVDPDAETLFVADESEKHYVAYGGSGGYAGRALGAGVIHGDPEGIALVRCGEDDGYWIVTDQQDDVSFFRVFDRASLAYLGTFRGRRTANTDGVTFEMGPVPGFPVGVLYAVHDDQALSAFDWGEAARALRLAPLCR